MQQHSVDPVGRFVDLFEKGEEDCCYYAVKLMVEEEEHNQRREAEEGLWQGNQLGFMELCLLIFVLEIFVCTYQLHIYR